MEDKWFTKKLVIKIILIVLLFATVIVCAVVSPASYARWEQPATETSGSFKVGITATPEPPQKGVGVLILSADGTVKNPEQASGTWGADFIGEVMLDCGNFEQGDIVYFYAGGQILKPALRDAKYYGRGNGVKVSPYLQPTGGGDSWDGGFEVLQPMNDLPYVLTLGHLNIFGIVSDNVYFNNPK